MNPNEVSPDVQLDPSPLHILQHTPVPLVVSVPLPGFTRPRFVLVDGKAQLEVPDGYVWTASALARVVKTLLGPKARIWNRPGRVTVGYQVGPNKIRLGGGQSPSEAFLATFAKPAEAMAREALTLPAPGPA